MTDTTREAVARAIYQARVLSPGGGMINAKGQPSQEWASAYAAADAALAALRPAQDAETRTFALGDRVTKISGSKWTGHVVGFYSTALTPEGYCVESETETGSVQIYPAKALALAALRPAQDAEGWVYKTYRVEWVAQTGHVDQYGREFKPDYERAFPTRDEALEHMKTLATYDERLMRWVTGKPYHQGEVSYREALAASPPRTPKEPQDG